MVKEDVESQAYRDSVTTLDEFSETNDLPEARLHVANTMLLSASMI